MDWLPELRDDDLDVLLEALEAWETKDLAGEVMGTVLETMLARDHGPMPSNLALERQKQKIEKQAAAKLRKERSVLLRAKLLTIRDRRQAEQLAAELRGG